MPSLGTFRPPPNDARCWDGEVDRETIGKAIDQSWNGSMAVSR